MEIYINHLKCDLICFHKRPKNNFIKNICRNTIEIFSANQQNKCPLWAVMKLIDLASSIETDTQKSCYESSF